MKAFLKKNFKWLIPALLVLIAGGVFGAYSYANRPCLVEEAYTIALTRPSGTLAVGETLTQELVFMPRSEKLEKRARADREIVEPVWSTSDPAVVTVSQSGVITAVYTGKATVTAQVESLTAVCEVEVFVPLTGVKLNNRDMTINVGDRVRVGYEPVPWDAVPPSEVKFSLSDNMVGRISPDNVFTGLWPGQTTLTLTADSYLQKCVFTVKAPLEGIAFDKPPAVLEGGQTAQLQTVLTPYYTTDDTTVTFASSDEAVLTVDAEGVVTAVGPGTASVTARCGLFETTCETEVIIPMTGIFFSFNQLEMRHGDSLQIPVGYEPANTTDDRTLVWTSSNPGVMAVNENGVVTAVGPGQARVTATCGAFSAFADFNVIIPVTGVVISHGEISLNVGEYAGLAASVVPANTTESPYITWASDNPSVATVNEGGVVQAVGPGTATITANHDMVGAACVVHVFQPMTSLVVSPGAVTLAETVSAQLGVTFLPADTTDDRSVTWTSSDATVAVVDGSGVVTAVGEGSCVITATSNARGFAGQASVTVTPFVEVDVVYLSESERAMSAAGEQFTLVASFEPEDATGAHVSWSSNNTAAATVSEGGVVTAVGNGSAVITATVGDKTAACAVTVTLPEDPKIVVLDPGHGDGFPGASYGGVREEVINLITARACMDYLEANYYGVKVYMTRYDGTPVVPGNIKADLEGRAQIAQNHGADIMVSIHYNASVAHVATGCTAYVSFQPNVADQCIRLANCILPKIASTFGMPNRGAAQTRSDQYFDEYGNPQDYYAINRHCANRGIPGIIVEHCFMDTQTYLIQNNDNLVQFGICDAIGIAEYLGLQHK